MANTGPLTRRDLLRLAATGGVAAAVGLNWAEGGPRVAAAGLPATPDEALQELRAGNARFVAHNESSFVEDLRLIQNGSTETHEPFAAILSCADARVTPEIVFDQVMGDVFVCRVAGNIATPEIIASLEYSVAVLKTVKVIMVLGHKECGAVSSAGRLDRVNDTQISALYAPLRPAVVLANCQPSTPPATCIDDRIRLNARIQAITLRDSSPVISDKVKAGDLRVVAFYYDISNGRATELPL